MGLLSAFANRYVRAITGLTPHDCTSGYRCWRRDALARIPFDRIASVYDLMNSVMTAGLQRYCTEADPVVALKSRSNFSFRTYSAAGLL